PPAFCGRASPKGNSMFLVDKFESLSGLEAASLKVELEDAGVPFSTWILFKHRDIEGLEEEEFLTEAGLQFLIKGNFSEAEVAQKVLNARRLPVSETTAATAEPILTSRQDRLVKLLTSYEPSQRSRRREILEELKAYS